MASSSEYDSEAEHGPGEQLDARSHMTQLHAERDRHQLIQDHEYDFRVKSQRDRYLPAPKPRLLQFNPGYSYRKDPSLHISSSRI